MKYKLVMILLIAIIAISIYQVPAFAHRDGCHRWHSCPSDTGSYTCGDTGYCSECPDNNYCKAGQPISISITGAIQTNQPTLPSTPTSEIPEFPFATFALIISTFTIIVISRKFPVTL